MDELTKKRNQETIEKVIVLRTNSIEARHQARIDTRLAEDYMMHDPFTAAEKEVAKKNSKPLLRYNIIRGKLQTILGNEQSNRRRVKIICDYVQDDELIRDIDDNFRHIEYASGLQAKLIKHLADGLCYKLGGWLGINIDIDDYGYNTLSFQNLDKYCVHPDPEFCNEDLSDCGWIIFDTWKTLDEIKSLYEVDTSSEKDRKWWEEVLSYLNDERLKAGIDSEFKQGDKYLVCNLEERQTLDMKVCLVGDEYLKLTSDEISDLRRQGKKVEFIRKTTEKRIKKTCVVPHFDAVVLEERLNPIPVGEFSVVYATSFTDYMTKAKQPTWAHILLDVMDRINKGKSQEVDYITQKLGGVWLVQDGNKHTIADLKAAAGKPNAIVRVQSMKNKPERVGLSGEGASIQLIQQGIIGDLAFVEEISNITLAMQGRGGKSAESGKLFESKLQQSLISSNPFYELKNEVNRQIVSYFLLVIPHIYFEDNRVIEVQHNEDVERRMINKTTGESRKDVREVTFRAVLEDIQNTPNKLRESFETATEFWGWAANIGAILPQFIPLPVLIMNSDMRDKRAMAETAAAAQEAAQQQLMAKEAAEEAALIS